MIKLMVVGSSSKGNEFIIQDNDEYILLECGINNTKEIVNLNKVKGILISHQHLDHCRDVKNIKKYYNGKFYANKETLEKLPITELQKYEVENGKKFKVGNFEVIPFDVVHDVPNTNYLLRHIPSGIKILFITDTGEINYSFKDIDFFIVECNCDEDKLTYEDFKEVRLYNTHLSRQQTGAFLLNNINHNTKKVFLSHISSSDEDYLSNKTYIEEVLQNNKIEVNAIDPKQIGIKEFILKEDILGYDFD